MKNEYTSLAISSDEKMALPIGSHYFKCIFEDVEGERDVIGYYRTFKDAVKACKAFAKIEIEYFYSGEFVICEFEVARSEEGKFKGHLVAKYANDLAFKFNRFQ